MLLPILMLTLAMQAPPAYREEWADARHHLTAAERDACSIFKRPKAFDAMDAHADEAELFLANIAGAEEVLLVEGKYRRRVLVRPHRCRAAVCSECGTVMVREMTDAERRQR